MYTYAEIVNELLAEFSEISKGILPAVRSRDSWQVLLACGIEYLRDWYLLQNKSEKRMLPETKKIFDCVKNYMEEPALDVFPCFLESGN